MAQKACGYWGLAMSLRLPLSDREFYHTTVSFLIFLIQSLLPRISSRLPLDDMGIN
jgi:hypothetical protein